MSDLGNGEQWYVGEVIGEELLEPKYCAACALDGRLGQEPKGQVVELWIRIAAPVDSALFVLGRMAAVEEVFEVVREEGQAPSQDPHVEVIGHRITEELVHDDVEPCQIRPGWDADVVQPALNPDREGGSQEPVIARARGYQFEFGQI